MTKIKDNVIIKQYRQKNKLLTELGADFVNIESIFRYTMYKQDYYCTSWWLKKKRGSYYMEVNQARYVLVFSKEDVMNKKIRVQHSKKHELEPEDYEFIREFIFNLNLDCRFSKGGKLWQ